MAWLFIIFLLSATLNNLAGAIHDQEKLPSAVVVGTVFCDTCFQDDLLKNSHFIRGATVAVECGNEDGSRSGFRQEVKTDEHGEFKVHLPFSVSKHVKRIKRCSVKLIRSSEPYCAVSSRAVSSSLHLKSREQGEHIFSAGFFSFKPENQPEICNHKPSIKTSRHFSSEKNSVPSVPPFADPSFPPPLQDPPTPASQFHLPPLPVLPRLPPLPQLPPLPSLPGLPDLPPLPGKTKERKASESLKSAEFSDRKELENPDFFFPPPILPPNPFQPPPLLPPIIPQPPPLIPPLLPQPPPAPLIPPLLPQPPPAPLIPLPPFPFLTPPSPPPPAFPFPLPPLLPFPPPSSPHFPGIPPASSSSSSISSKNSSP